MSHGNIANRNNLIFVCIERIPEASLAKFLGITIDEKLNFNRPYTERNSGIKQIILWESTACNETEPSRNINDHVRVITDSLKRTMDHLQGLGFVPSMSILLEE